MSKVFDFLTDIAVNPKQQVVFLSQPDTAIGVLELSEEDKAIIQSRSSTKIAALFANDITPSALICNDPNPEDPFPDPDPEPEPEPNDPE